MRVFYIVFILEMCGAHEIDEYESMQNGMEIR